MQMVEQEPRPFWSGWRKIAILTLAGGVFGYFAGHAAAVWMRSGGALEYLAGSEPAFIVAMLYMVMGLFVGLGSLSPRIGALLLNVEDADEVREQASMLRWSALGTILLALTLVAIALGGPSGPLSPEIALTTGLAALAGGVATAIATSRQSDEFMRALMRESGSASYLILFVLLGGWAAAGFVEVLPAPTPIGILSLIWAAPLLATYWVLGRRGMLKPRS